MSDLFFRNPRLLVLTVALILVSGLSAYHVLPRMEDPLLTKRVAIVTTRFPGADAQRVESLVTENLEKELLEIDEIKELRSQSRTGVSLITMELRDDIYEVDAVWSRIRDRLDDAQTKLPASALEPQFEEMHMKAYAMIVALVWDGASADASELLDETNFAILRRLAKQLDDSLLAIPGTELVDTFGDPDEEVVVEVDPSKLTPLGLTVAGVARQLGASDAKISAGQLRSRDDLLMEVAGEFDSLERVRRTPIQYGDEGGFVRVTDVARVGRGIRHPPSSLALVDGKPAITLGVLVLPDRRVDHWTAEVQQTLDSFADTLPRGVSLSTVFRQTDYVEKRLTKLLGNLLLGAAAITLVIFVLMGWRSAVVISASLPLAALMVLGGMRWCDIPIDQMSVTGLIIALGLLIDNAIVIVDVVNGRLRGGAPPGQAVSRSVRHLALPLFGSTITTALAFAPIAMMPGPTGEFVGSIAISVIVAIFSSLFLAMTVIPALTALFRRIDAPRNQLLFSASVWWRDGFRWSRMTMIYRRTLAQIFARPWLGITATVALPVFGFMQISKLPEQFFPPSGRDQFQIELELNSTASIQESISTAAEIRRQIMQRDDVKTVSWFLGESAPMFYYNVVPRRRNNSNYAQALVQLKPGRPTLAIVRELQAELDVSFPDSRVLVRQLEQGPPFDAPVEVRIDGPDLQVLGALGEQVRSLMSQTPNVVHTRADLGDTVAKMTFQVDEEKARLAGLDHTEIASQLSATLEGAIAGSILEDSEELPVRVRVSNHDRASIESIASLELIPPRAADNQAGSRVPVSALASMSVVPQVATIPRFRNRRVNEVQAYTAAGVLPATVLSDLQSLLRQSSFQLPPGYSMEIGGEAAKRNDAIGNLMMNAPMLVVLMVATLVLSFRSFRIASIIGIVAAMSIGLGIGALWCFGYPMGFMAIIGTMGLMGVAINDTIVVLAAIREDEAARLGVPAAVGDVVVRSTRHIVATSLTTMAGFIPLLLGGGGFWPPVAVTIAGGVGGATILALYFAPSAYILLMCHSGAEVDHAMEEDSDQRQVGPDSPRRRRAA